MDYLEIRELYHHGIKGQRWGIRRFQNEDGSLTPDGVERYRKFINSSNLSEKDKLKLYKSDLKELKKDNALNNSFIDKEKISRLESERDSTVDEFEKECHKIGITDFDKLLRPSYDDTELPEYYKKRDRAETLYWVAFDDGYQYIQDAKDEGKDVRKINKIIDNFGNINGKIDAEYNRTVKSIIDDVYGKETINNYNKDKEFKQKVANGTKAVAATLILVGGLSIASRSGNKK